MILPLSLLLLALVAFALSAAALVDGRDLAGLYFLAVALVAARAQQRVTARSA